MKKKKDGFYNKYIKRLLDIIFSLLGLVILSPLLLILTVLSFIFMKDNPFFVQPRPGKIDLKTGKEKTFNLIKFRTMTNERDKDGNLLPDEKRLNRYGLFLRTLSFDELPQFINVLVGDMSFIGCRPLLTEYLPYYSAEQRRRHEVRPGISGWAQVNGRNAISWENKFELDVWYVDHISFALDCKILLMTILNVLNHSGIHSSTSVTMEKFNEISIETREKIHQ